MKVVGNVWMLKYEHKHGEDITHWDEEETALEQAKEIINDNIENEEGDKEKKVVLAALANNDIHAACDAWSELTGNGEYISVSHHEIYSSKNGIDIMKEALDEGQRE
jgi:hypothetical protein